MELHNKRDHAAVADIECVRAQECMDTFLQLHGKEVQLLHPFLQLVLSGGRHGVDVIVAAVVVLIGVGGEDLQMGGSKGTRLVGTELLLH